MPQNPQNLNTLNTAGKLAPQHVDNQGAEIITSGGLYATSINATGVVKASPGRLCKVTVTTVLSAAAITFYDNASAASGTVLAVIPASAAVGTVYDFQISAVNGIYASFGGTGALSIGFN